MGVISDARTTAPDDGDADEQTTDARQPSDVSTRDPFLNGYDTSRIKLDAESAEQIGNLVFAIGKLAGAL